jgi:hypothetical protein
MTSSDLQNVGRSSTLSLVGRWAHRFKSLSRPTRWLGRSSAWRRAATHGMTLCVGVIGGLIVNSMWESFTSPRLEIERAVGYSEGSQVRLPDSLVLSSSLYDLRYRQRVWHTRWAGIRTFVDSATIAKQIILKLGILNRGRVAARNLRIPVVAGVAGQAQLNGSANVTVHLERDSVRWSPIDVIVLESVPPKTRVLVTYTFSVDPIETRSLMEIAEHFRVEGATAEDTGPITLPDTIAALGYLISEEMRDKPGGSAINEVQLYPLFTPGPNERGPFVFGKLDFDTAYWNRLYHHQPNNVR